MYESTDVVKLFAGVVNGLKQGRFDLDTPLEEIVLRTSETDLAYVDDRKEARGKYDVDFWSSIKKQCENSGENFMDWVSARDVDKGRLYSRSQQFPDFMFRVGKRKARLTCGSLLELKDAKGGSIASFNSTIPTKYKNLDEIDIINGKSLVSKIAAIMDGELALHPDYCNLQRRSFYFVRTHKGGNRVRMSIVDGSFFETVPKDHLIYQMFLNVLRGHLEKKDVEIPQDIINQVEKSLSYITDQTIIAASQTIERASVRPRLRIMAEVHTEGNPHSSSYPEISAGSFNLILEKSTYEEEVEEMIDEKSVGIEMFTIQHKRNGKHVVFQFRPNANLY